MLFALIRCQEIEEGNTEKDRSILELQSVKESLEVHLKASADLCQKLEQHQSELEETVSHQEGQIIGLQSERDKLIGKVKESTEKLIRSIDDQSRLEVRLCQICVNRSKPSVILRPISPISNMKRKHRSGSWKNNEFK